MVYSPRLKEVSDHLIIENVLAIVQRDMKPALDYFYPADSLPDFAERMIGRFFKQTYPSFAVEPNRNGPEQAADGSFIEAALRIYPFLSVVDADPPTVEKKAMKYTRALVSILRNASVADYTANITSGVVFSLTWEVSYEYGLIGKNAQGWEKPVSFELLLKFNER